MNKVFNGTLDAMSLMGIRVNHDKLARDFVSLVNQIRGTTKPHRVFDDWCEFCYLGFKMMTADANQHHDLLGRYNEMTKGYPEDRIRGFVSMTSIAKTALRHGGDDFLGRVCGMLGSLDQGVGQFFTPFDATTLVLEIGQMDIPSIIKRDGFCVMGDPTAGAGGMIVGMADQAQAQGADLADVFFEGVELVPATYHMLFVQMCLRGVAGRAVCGDTLSNEVFEVSYTPAAIAFISKHGPVPLEMLPENWWMEKNESPEG